MIRMCTLTLGFAIATALLMSVAAHSAVLYVDKDNPCPGAGTTGNPYCSIANAVNAVQAGDTIRIRDAATPYTESIVTGKTGTVSSRIIVEPDIGHNPTLRNSGNGATCATFWIQGGSYWTIQKLNFNATGVSPCAFGAILVQSWTSGNNQGNEILNNTFKGWGGPSSPVVAGMAALVISGGANGPTQGFWPTATRIVGNTFDANRLINITVAHTDGTIIANNEFKNTTCGLDTDGATNELGVKAIYHNKNIIVENNQFHDFDSSGNCRSLTGWPTFAAYWCDVGGSNAIIRNNRIWNIDRNSDVNNLGIFASGIFIEAECHSHKVERNIIHDVKSAAFYNSYHSLNSSQPANVYVNNTIYNIPGWGFFLKEGVIHIKNNIVKNAGKAALCLGCGSGAAHLIALQSNYNLYDDGASQAKIGQAGSVMNLTNWRSTCNCDPNSIIGNPQFVNESSADFRLQASSPARGAGEGGVDIGAYSYDSAGIPLTPSALQLIPN